MPGPAAAPPSLRVLHGRGTGTDGTPRDSGGRPIPASPKFRRLPPNPPTWLSTEAKAEWRRVVPELARLELLKPVDRAALAAYCETWAVFVDAQRRVREDGLTIKAKQGMLPHPAVGIARAAGRELRAWAHEFGLTPSAEGKLAAGAGDGPADDNPFG